MWSELHNKPSTVAAKRIALDVHLLPELGDVRLDASETRAEVARFVTAKQYPRAEFATSFYMRGRMSGVVLGWDAWAGDNGIKHANTVQLGGVQLGGTPEDAVLQVIERATVKYGPQDWSTWEYRAEPIPKTSGADVVRFVWRDGGLVQFERR